ncbi:RipA family octameric membrane protein [Pseudarthrobacter sp. J75]|uniref:RipA family octameric membrane protein n=1 Tax=Pseudarthrobacter sp. J75 TaxID=3116486 RepID=UPI003FA6B8F2
MRKKPEQPTLELYKLAVEMADRVSARRGTANQFYLSLETLILGAPIMAQYLGSNSVAHPELLTALSVAGVLVAIVWWLQLRSYRELNSAKFKVINEIEDHHFEVKVFRQEWLELKQDRVPRWRPRYLLCASSRPCQSSFALRGMHRRYTGFTPF